MVVARVLKRSNHNTIANCGVVIDGQSRLCAGDGVLVMFHPSGREPRIISRGSISGILQ